MVQSEESSLRIYLEHLSRSDMRHSDVSYTIPARLLWTKVTAAFHASSATSAQHFPSQAKILMRGMRRQNAIVYIDSTDIRWEEV
jgi:hypothetical protein